MPVLVSANFASPNCSKRCGNISIPYPFGISNGCHREGFKLDCNKEYHPPKLFMDSSGVEVLEISAQHSTLSIDSGILSLVGSESMHATWAVPLNSNIYTMSALRNDLVVLGCGFWVLLGWTLQEATASSMKYDCVPGDPTKRACSSKSSNECNSPVLGSDSNLITIKLAQLSQTFPINASLAIMEDGWRKESALMLQKAVSSDTSLGASKGELHSIPGVPIRTVISWVFNNLSCAEAMDSSDYGCLSNNSYCQDYQGDSTIGGYRCNCRHGYQGNSYEHHGCQDVDECINLGEYCFGQCINLIGSYTCTCPHGTTGNPREQNGCSSTESAKEKNSGFFTAVGIGSGAGVLLIILGVLYVRGKLIVWKAKKSRDFFFKQNRGLLLQRLVDKDIAERMMFSLEELEKATNKFDKARKLGGGGHGTVYKGILL